MATTFPDTDPRHHTANIRNMLDAVISHARGDIDKVSDPKARALFETTAEVLEGLKTAYEHFDKGQEAGFRDAGPANSRTADSNVGERAAAAPELAGFEE
ncbi:MAG TPA: hypothetical protein VKU82_11730 [Planctomycetaceae bacterium]|nr:hypothetical protein [Planctomycetaceae bacterium]